MVLEVREVGSMAKDQKGGVREAAGVLIMF